jgi:hypothetical protein
MLNRREERGGTSDSKLDFDDDDDDDDETTGIEGDGDGGAEVVDLGCDRENTVSD